MLALLLGVPYRGLPVFEFERDLLFWYNGLFIVTPLKPQPSSGEKALCVGRLNFMCALSKFDFFVDDTRACTYWHTS